MAVDLGYLCVAVCVAVCVALRGATCGNRARVCLLQLHCVLQCENTKCGNRSWLCLLRV